MFLDIDKKNPDSKALLDDTGLGMTYGELCGFSDEFFRYVGKRTLIFILCKNNVEAAAGYLASLSGRIVPLLLSEKIDGDILQNLLEIYRPEFIWITSEKAKDFGRVVWEKYNFSLVETGFKTFPLYEHLSLLLPTSGSTGSPKLVRHSYDNVEASARNVADFFKLDETERPMLDSPINYTYGLSILSSHIYAGSTVLLTSGTVLSGEYWHHFKANNATSITGVPYTYELLKKLRFFKMDLPSLRTLSQGGGKMADDLFIQYAEYAKMMGRLFIPTYGQSESTARMTGLAPEYAASKTGSIGKAIPNGKATLMDEDGKAITQAGKIGEIVYEGPNVTLGYAGCGDDLAKGDERQGILHTGDMSKMDEDGFLYIVGRKNRFLKLHGTRVSLDESERLIRSKFDTECACAGSDDKMKIFITDPNITEEVNAYIAAKTGIHPIVFEVINIRTIPRNDAGKILYNEL